MQRRESAAVALTAEAERKRLEAVAAADLKRRQCADADAKVGKGAKAAVQVCDCDVDNLYATGRTGRCDETRGHLLGRGAAAVAAVGVIVVRLTHFTRKQHRATLFPLPQPLARCAMCCCLEAVGAGGGGGPGSHRGYCG